MSSVQNNLDEDEVRFDSSLDQATISGALSSDLDHTVHSGPHTDIGSKWTFAHDSSDSNDSNADTVIKSTDATSETSTAQDIEDHHTRNEESINDLSLRPAAMDTDAQTSSSIRSSVLSQEEKHRQVWETGMAALSRAEFMAQFVDNRMNQSVIRAQSKLEQLQRFGAQSVDDLRSYAYDLRFICADVHFSIKSTMDWTEIDEDLQRSYYSAHDELELEILMKHSDETCGGLDQRA